MVKGNFTVGFLLMTSCLLAQHRMITGIVKDKASDLALIGATVVVDGDGRGTVTDLEGRFSLELEAGESTLGISYTGYDRQVVEVTGKTEVVVYLEQGVELEEVVVVGYGKQKAVNLTGSVVSINEEKLQNRGVSTVSNILAGQTPGLTVLQRGGSPGRNEGELRIRGIGTLGAGVKNNPLIIVDGIETGSLTDVNPSDIATVSVLKDAAAAAIYGVRAANGVLIVTTKRGKAGKIITTYNTQFSRGEAVNLPEKVSSLELAELLNEAQRNEGLTTRFFSSDDLSLFENGDSPGTHANAQQLEEVFTQNAFRQSHDLTFSGGSEETLFNVSLGYLDENGLMVNTGLKRYNFRSNLDVKLNDRLGIGLNLAGIQRRINDPIVGVGGIIHRAYREWATDPIWLPNGNWAIPHFALAQGINHNAVALLNNGGDQAYVDTRLTGTFFAEYKVSPSLSVKGITATVQDFNRRKVLQQSLVLYNIDGNPANTSSSRVLEGRDNNSDLNFQLLANYDKSFGNHGLRGLLGFNARQIESIFGSYSALDLRNNQLDQINAADLTQDEISGSSSDYRLLSYFGRLNYAFGNRYLLEANLRYDGTSRFAPSNRYQAFPSFSVAWRISQEPSFKSRWIEDLKIRASWGKLGNQEIGNYQFLNTYVFNQTAFIGNTEQSGATERIPLGNTDILWESTEAINFGLNLSLWHGQLEVTADYFIRKTSDVLIQKPLAGVFGTGTSNFPFVNGAATENEGFEIALNYRGQWRAWKLSANFNFSQVTTTITDLLGTDQPGFSVGDPIANIYGYEALSIFQSQEEVESHADQSALGTPTKPGDIKYKDLNGDGVVNSMDRKNLGSFFPGINYGATIRAQYKNFDFSSLWQGVADVVAETGGRQRQPFYLGSSPWKLHLDRAKTDRDGNVINPEARYPRTLINGNTKNYVTSSWWVESTAFLKLRNAQLGYTFPASVLEKLGLIHFRFYVSGENLLTFTRFKGFDPEIPTTGSALPLFGGNSGYPVTRTYLIGLNVSF